MQNAVKVLIAEDEPNALAGLAELISGWGYRTETARDGVEAWEKALAWDPAIVVTDLKMPRMDGMGLLAKLAEGGAGPERQHGRGGAHRHGLDSAGRGGHEAGRLRLSAEAGGRHAAEDHPGQRHAAARDRDRAGSGAAAAARDRACWARWWAARGRCGRSSG